MPHPVPESRLRALTDLPPRGDGANVLYWMQSARRGRANFALQHAAELARALDRPLLVVETIEVDEPWASDRLHGFALQGVQDNAAHFARRGIAYRGYLEQVPGSVRALIAALARDACAVVTDSVLPEARADLAAERGAWIAVDSAGLLPLSTTLKAHATARGFRRLLHAHARESLEHAPAPDPLARIALRPFAHAPHALANPAGLLEVGERTELRGLLDALPIDHRVAPVAGAHGGAVAARRHVARYVRERLCDYGDARRHPDADAESGLSPWLRFGHLGVHEVLARIASHEGWSPDRLRPDQAGQREGFWGLSPSAEAFVDELSTWRELSLNGAMRLSSYRSYDSLPPWARHTLERHADDPRPHLYSLEQLECAETHDSLWNAAQRELLAEGRMHNYLRMLWGKKILHWTRSPREAHAIMVELNNRYALDGRDPNSYAGIGWVLGRYDRPWGPERPVFGVVRYMSSDSARKKLRLARYLDRRAA